MADRYCTNSSPTQTLIELLRAVPRDGAIGTVYCVSRVTAPCLFKIGRTSGPVATRLRALNCGSVDPLVLRWKLLVRGHIEAERAIHQALGCFRVDRNREFFNLPWESIEPLRDVIAEEVGVDQLAYLPR